MTKKKRPNITPEDIGMEYKDAEGHVYRLIACETEPMATMRDLDGLTDNPIEKPISEFANFVRLVPEREIPKPDKPRKQRSDKGRTHTKAPEDLTASLRKARAKRPGKIDIEKIGLAVAHDDQPAWATYKDTAASSPTIKGAVLDLFVGLGIAGAEKVREYVKAQPDSANKTILLNALGG